MWMVAISSTVINKFPFSLLLKVKRNSNLEKQLKLTLASENNSGSHTATEWDC